MKKKIKVHAHPRMEVELKVPQDHVIIDKELFWRIFEIHNMWIYPEETFISKGVVL